MTTYLELPRNLEINGVHVQHWRSRDLVIYQNYSATTPPSDQPIAEPGGMIVGQNLFHLFSVDQHNPGESLGQKLGSFSDLRGAMDAASRLT